MPKREVLKSIIVGRGPLVEVPGEKDGRGKPLMVSEQRIELQIGQVFDFTDEELKHIMATDPSAVSSRTTVDLDASGDDIDPRKTGDETLPANQSSAPSLSGVPDGDDSL